MKKLIGMVLGICILTSLFAVNASAEVASAGLEGSKYEVYNQDFEGDKKIFGTHGDDAFGTAKEITDETGSHMQVKMIQDPNTSATDAYWWLAAASGGDLDLETGVVMRFDVQKINEGFPIRVSFHDTEYSDKYFDGVGAYSVTGVVIKSNSIPQKDKWYTIEIRAIKTPDTQSAGDVDVYIFDKETGEGTKISDIVVDWTSMFSRNANNNGKIWFGPVGGDAAYIPSGYNYWDTEYLFDNFSVYNRVPMESYGVYFERDYQTPEGTKYSSDMTSLGITGVMSHELADDNGNVYRNIKYVSAAKENFFLNHYTGNKLPYDNFMFSVDVIKKTESGSIQFDIGPDQNSSNRYGKSFLIPAKQLEKDVWYSYKVTVQGDEIKAYRKAENEDAFAEIAVKDLNEAGVKFNEWTETEPVIMLTPYREAFWNNAIFVAIMKNQYAVYGADEGKIGNNAATGSEYGFDNLKIADFNSATLINRVKDGVLYTNINVDVADVSATAFMPMIGYYNESGILVGVDYVKSAVSAGTGSVTYGINATSEIYSTVANGGYAEVYIWSEDGAPLIEAVDLTEKF